jgi:hypothetical protein
VPEAIAKFGHTAAQVDEIMAAGRRATVGSSELAPKHAAALYAYTQEEPQLYRPLNYALYTPGAQADAKLVEYRDYIKHTTTAANCLPNYVGATYRGTNRIFKASLYKPGDVVTWQAFSSSSRSQLQVASLISLLDEANPAASFAVILSSDLP